MHYLTVPSITHFDPTSKQLQLQLLITEICDTTANPLMLCCYFSAYLCSVFFCFCLDVFQCVKLIFCSSCLGIPDIWTCPTQRFTKITLKYLRAFCENCLMQAMGKFHSYRYSKLQTNVLQDTLKHMKPFCDT